MKGLDAWLTQAPEGSDDGDCDAEVQKECPTCGGEGGVLVGEDDVACATCKGSGFTEQTCGGNINQVGNGFACDSCDWTEGPDDQ